MSGPPRPAAIVFDWDNTLVDTWPVIHDALTETLKAMGHEPWSLEKTRRMVRQSLRDTFPVLFGDRWTEARDVFFEAFGRIHIERLQPLDGAAELLAALTRKGVHLAILSNKVGHYLRAETEHLGWSGFFASIVGAGDAARDKPAPESLDLALAGAPVPAGEAVWIVGDADIDMEVAHRNGCLPVLLHRDPAEPEFRRFPPRHCFPGCIGLLNCIAEW